MKYKGQTLSDNLTSSQIRMYKGLIDKGMTVKEIKLMNLDPKDVVPKEERKHGGAIKKFEGKKAKKGMLVGKQKQLDKNKDGRISGEDFALLRKS